MGLAQEGYQRCCQASIIMIEKGRGQSDIAGTSRATDAMNVVIKISRKIKVNHMRHV